MTPPNLLAHSARRPGATPQRYEEHIGNVRKGARARAEAMLQFALPGLDGLADAIEAAAIFHDWDSLTLKPKRSSRKDAKQSFPGTISTLA